MKFPKMLAALEALCGALIALTPIVLPVCQGMLTTTAGKAVPMRCYYTGQAEMALGALVAIVGVLAFVFGKQAETRVALNVVVLALGAVVLLVPTVLIGACASPDMACNLGTKPALLLLGSLTVVLGALGIWEAWRSSRRAPTAAA